MKISLHTAILILGLLIAGLALAGGIELTGSTVLGVMRVYAAEVATKRFSDMWDASRAAFETAMQAKKVERAMHYVVLGCKNFDPGHACHSAVWLREYMSRRDEAVAAVFASEAVRLAGFVYLPSVLHDNVMKNSTGVLCNYYARQLALAATYKQWRGEPSETLSPYHGARKRPTLAARLSESKCVAGLAGAEPARAIKSAQNLDGERRVPRPRPDRASDPDDGGERNEGKRVPDQSAIHSGLPFDPRDVLDDAVREWSHGDTKAIPVRSREIVKGRNPSSISDHSARPGRL